MSDESDNAPELPAKLPEPVRHTLELRDGRTLAYCTFATDDDAEGESSSGAADDDDGKRQRKRHQPVIYLHGFPGTGLEGAVCASHVSNAGGRLYAPDRPGFGRSDPLPAATDGDPDGRVKAVVDDVWELVKSEGWTSFSVIGVSGGGPYTLAVLSSYLDMDGSRPPPPARLDAVSLVGGINCSAGTEGMMRTNQDLVRLVGKKTWASELQLSVMFGMMTAFAKVLPSGVLLSMGPMGEVPDVDKDAMKDPTIGQHMIRVLRDALRQGSTAARLEAETLFRPEQGFEETLMKRSKSRLEEELAAPKVGIFHGRKDVNVPISHSTHTYRKFLHEGAEFVEYKELGHLSMVASKADEYSRFAVASAL